MFRIFRNDGRTLVLAMDHGGAADVHPGLANPAKVLDDAVEAVVDAVLTTPGVVREFAGNLKTAGVILRVDGGTSDLRARPEYRLLATIEDALRLGVDAVACMGFTGTSMEVQTLENLSVVARECHVWDMPLMAEMIPGGFIDPSLVTTENVRLAARIGAELGADIIKTEFVESGGSFRQVTEHCYRTVVVLGGGKRSEADLFAMLRSAMDAGAAGAAIGRNIWGHAHPKAMVKAIGRIIHEGVSVAEALDILATGSR